MTEAALASVMVIVLAAAVAPFVADLLRRWVTVPSTVLEIGLGILVGPAALGLARSDDLVDALAGLGLAMLFFLAGYEIDFTRIRGGPLTRAVASWGISLPLGLAIGALLAVLLGGGGGAVLAFGLALTTTTLGTILPIVKDSGMLPTTFGANVMAVGAIGEFGPILAVALLLSGERPMHSTALLIIFAAIAVSAAGLAVRSPPPRMTRLLTATLGTSGQFAVRICVLVVLAMVWLATELHQDLVLGAFAAGVVVKLLLTGLARREVVESKLEGIGFGLLIPIFFVTTGVDFSLRALASSSVALALVPVGLAAFLLVRGAPVALLFRRDPDRRALGLYASTQLPLVIVITGIGVNNGWLTAASAAGLVGAAMLSVLIYPVLALRAVAPKVRRADGR